MHKAIVLDLDETLIHTFDSTDSAKTLRLLTDPRHIEIRKECYILDFYDAREDKQYHMWGIRRPYLDEFLDFCFNKFGLVIVWTAGSADYADAIVNAIFNTAPHLIFSREHCREFRGNIVKPLKDLFDYEPKLSKLTSLDNMIMIDDVTANFKFNPKNGITIHSFNPRITDIIHTDDDYLLLVKDYITDLITHRGNNIGNISHEIFV